MLSCVVLPGGMQPLPVSLDGRNIVQPQTWVRYANVTVLRP